MGTRKNRRTSKSSNVTSIEQVLEERGSNYGLFKDQAKIVQDLKHIMHSTPGWDSLSDDKKEGLEMIQHKIGRILNGNPEFKDSWEDIEGYARCVSREL